MLVRDCMTANPISVHPESDPLAAIALCRAARIRRLPVVNTQGQVVGIITRNDLELFLSKAPSPGILKRQHRVEQIMVTPVITVSSEYPIEEAARLMVEHKVGSLPVVENGRLVGIITETDIFKQFVEILGGDAEALRLTVMVADVPGQLAKIVNAVAALSANIRSLVISRCEDPGSCLVTLWVEEADRDTLVTVVQNIPDVQLVQLWSKSTDAGA